MLEKTYETRNLVRIGIGFSKKGLENRDLRKRNGYGLLFN